MNMKVLFTLICCVIISSCKIGYLAVNPVVKNQLDYNAKSIYAINNGNELDIYLVNEIAAPILSLQLDKAFINTNECKNQTISDILTEENLISIKGDMCGETQYQLDIRYINNEQINLDLQLSNSLSPTWDFVWKKGTNESILGHETNKIEANSHQSTPFYISSTHKAFHILNEYATIETNNNSNFKITTNRKALAMDIWQKADYKSLVSSFNENRKSLVNLPKWGLGTSLILEGGQASIYAQLDSLLNDSCLVDAIVLKDWAGVRLGNKEWTYKQYWEADMIAYPNLNELSDSLHALGIDLLATFSPLIENEGDLYQIAKENGYLVRTKVGGVGIPQGIDFDNKAAMQWYASLISSEILPYGFDGWIAQKGQTAPLNGKALSSFDASKWTKWNQMGLTMNREYFISEAAGQASPQHTSIYKIPTEAASWKAMRAGFTQLMQQSNTGLPVVYLPIWNGQENKSIELQQRMIELAAFLPIYQADQVLKNEDNVTILEDTLRTHFVQFAKIHEELAPYLRELANKHEVSGLPMVRHLSLEFPDDPVAFGINEQFMLGDDLLIAPVFKKGKKEIKVYLPKGNWEHIFTKQVFAGPSSQWIQVPIGVPAVFRRK